MTFLLGGYELAKAAIGGHVATSGWQHREQSVCTNNSMNTAPGRNRQSALRFPPKSPTGGQKQSILSEVGDDGSVGTALSNSGVSNEFQDRGAMLRLGNSDQDSARMAHGWLRRHTLWVACVCADNWFTKSAFYVLTLYLYPFNLSKFDCLSLPRVFLCVRVLKAMFSEL